MATSVYLPLFASIIAAFAATNSSASEASVALPKGSVNASAAVAIAQSAQDASLKRAQLAIDTLIGFDVTVNGAAQDASCIKASVASLTSDAFRGNVTGDRAKMLKECFEHARKADKTRLEELKIKAKRSIEAFKTTGIALTDALKRNGTAGRILEHIRHNISRVREELQRRADHATREVEKRVEHFYREAERRTEDAAHKLDEVAEAKKKLEKEAAEAKTEVEKKAEDVKHDAEALAKIIAKPLIGSASKKSNHSNQGDQQEQLAEIDARHIYIVFFALVATMSAFAMAFVVVKKHHVIVEPGNRGPPVLSRSPFEYPASSSGKACTISYDGVEVRV